MITLNRNKPAQVSIVANGPVRVEHLFEGSDAKGTKHKIGADVSWEDNDPNDLDRTKDHVDTYSISKLTKSSDDRAFLDWELKIARDTTQVFYEVRIQIIQGGFVSKPEVYRSDDPLWTDRLVRADFNGVMIRLED